MSLCYIPEFEKVAEQYRSLKKSDKGQEGIDQYTDERCEYVAEVAKVRIMGRDLCNECRRFCVVCTVTKQVDQRLQGHP